MLRPRPPGFSRSQLFFENGPRSQTGYFRAYHEITTLIPTYYLAKYSRDYRRPLQDGFLLNEWRLCAREREPLGVLAVQVNDFEEFKSSYGAEASQNCLLVIAGIMRLFCLRRRDLVFRLGEDGFIAVLPATFGVQHVAGCISDVVKMAGIEHGRGFVVTVSVGAGFAMPTESGTPDSLVTAVMDELAEAKNTNAGAVRCAPAPANPELVSDLICRLGTQQRRRQTDR